jgi:hypothetical protein
MSSEQAQSSVPVRRSLLVLLAALLTCGASLPAQTVHVSPALPTTQDAVVLSAGLGCSPIFPPTIVGHTITVSALSPPPPCFPNIDFFQFFALPSLEAGSYTVNWKFVGTEAPDETVLVFQVTAPTQSLTMQNGRFLVTATFTNPVTGAQQAAQAVQLSDESGYFWFFGSTNTELSLKILNGQIINGRSWLFLASMTTVGFTVKVTDLRTPPDCTLAGDNSSCFSKTYTSPAGTNQNFFDLQSFTGTTP